MNFIGHIGGDDFIAVLREPDWESRCRALIEEFAREVRRHYDPAAIAESGIHAHNRMGERQFFPLVTLSVGIVQPDPAACHSYHAVSALAMDAKQEAKRIEGNTLFISRRRRPEQPVGKPMTPSAQTPGNGTTARVRLPEDDEARLGILLTS